MFLSLEDQNYTCNCVLWDSNFLPCSNSFFVDQDLMCTEVSSVTEDRFLKDAL